MAIEVRRYSPVAAPYLPTLDAMRRFTAERGPDTPDQIWLLHHPPVFTLGQAGKAEHLHDAGTIPVVRTERGGQVTYHGPGQVVAYLLLDLRRRGILVRDLVCLIEKAVMATTALHCVQTMARAGAPGVYLRQADATPGAKIASLGLKVSRGCTYHGVALNVAMDLEPFGRIDPCGFPGLAVTDLQTQAGPLDVPVVADELARCLLDQLESPT